MPIAELESMLAGLRILVATAQLLLVNRLPVSRPDESVLPVVKSIALLTPPFEVPKKCEAIVILFEALGSLLCISIGRLTPLPERSRMIMCLCAAFMVAQVALAQTFLVALMLLILRTVVRLLLARLQADRMPTLQIPRRLKQVLIELYRLLYFVPRLYTMSILSVATIMTDKKCPRSFWTAWQTLW